MNLIEALGTTPTLSRDRDQRECNLCNIDNGQITYRCAHFDGQVLLLHSDSPEINGFICCVPEGSQNKMEDHYSGYIKSFKPLSEAEAVWPMFEEAFLKGGDEFHNLFEHSPSSE